MILHPRSTATLRMMLLSALSILWLANVAAAQEVTDDDRDQALAMLNQGVQAYKAANFDRAIDDFRRAKELDPSLTNARLYLATAYASLYVPGAPSKENVRYGELALQEFRDVLDKDPANISAIEGVGAILYNMGSSPFDRSRLIESKSYHEKHIELQPDDPEAYYWVGVIDWLLAFRANKDMRDEYNQVAKHPVKQSDPMPSALAAQFAQKYGADVDDGISKLQKAMILRPEYDDAMAYLNLLYRQKADMETSRVAREDDLRRADDLIDQVKNIKQRKELQTP